MIPVDIDNGEIPIYVEVMIEDRDKFMSYLESKNIQSRAIYADLHSAEYLRCKESFPNAELFGKNGLILPCGPDQPIKNIERVIKLIKSYK